MKIGLFFGSTTCYTEMVAEKMQISFSAHTEMEIVLHNIKDEPLSLCQEYDFLIFGISTWDYGELQEDWESSWPEVAQLDLSGKVLALYGMGDQVGYSEWFQDALGMLHEQLLPTDAYVIGYWPNTGYEFISSKALTADQQNFVGLSLDDETQYQLTDKRIEQWVKMLNDEIKEILAT
jgi:flavodoxin II